MAQQSASDAARGAFTIGFVGSAIGVVVIVSAALCLLFKRTSYVGGGGCMSVSGEWGVRMILQVVVK